MYIEIKLRITIVQSYTSTGFIGVLPMNIFIGTHNCFKSNKEMHGVRTLEMENLRRMY